MEPGGIGTAELYDAIARFISYLIDFTDYIGGTRTPICRTVSYDVALCGAKNRVRYRSQAVKKPSTTIGFQFSLDAC